MRILVCGGRDFNDIELFKKVMFNNIPPGAEIITGMAKGADHMAWKWGHLMGLVVHEFPADWDTYGKKAGPMRNIQMLVEGKPDLVIAFPGGTGTAHMKKIARAAGIKVIEI